MSAFLEPRHPGAPFPLWPGATLSLMTPVSASLPEASGQNKMGGGLGAKD